jgi:hypothetical protein
MKFLVIPDVHGIKTWKYAVSTTLAEIDAHIIFLGDYVDSFNINASEILFNLKNIIDVKIKYPNRVTLLLGNHDYAYIFNKIHTSGYNFVASIDYKQIFNDNWKLFDLAYGFSGTEKYTLFTHAGLTNYFYNKLVTRINDPESILNDILIKDTDTDIKTLPIHELLNYIKDEADLIWTVGNRRGGTAQTGSIVWADKDELCKNAFDGIDQIVGHTNSYYTEIVSIQNSWHDYDKLYFTDTHTDTNLTSFMIDLH